MKIIYSPHSQPGLPPGPPPGRKNEFSGKPDRTMALHKNHPNEEVAALAILPILATVGFYLLPEAWKAHRLCQFAPQIIAYVNLGIWAVCNANIIPKLGLQPTKISAGIRLGLLIGLLLGSFNTTLILYGVPALGLDIEFLRNVPHAHIPLTIMVPWFIVFIAFAVEMNFRGFLLGRLLALFSHHQKPSKDLNIIASVMALGISSLAFAFDPFMVSTFQHLHWIAVWDGFIWGWMWLRTRNLYIPVAAHSIEVIIEYLVIRAALA
jgi:membrane protease YdiL (CAAX protease family)